jgi:hypothetical protein
MKTKRMIGLLFLVITGCCTWNHKTSTQCEVCVGQDVQGKEQWVDSLVIKKYEKENKVSREDALRHFRETMHLAKSPNAGMEIDFDFDIHDFPWEKCKGREISKDTSKIGQDEKEKTFICVGKDAMGKMMWADALEIEQYEKENRVTRDAAVEQFRKERHLARTPNLGEEKIKVDFDVNIDDLVKESGGRIVDIKVDSSPKKPAEKSSSSNQEGPSSP